MRGHSLGRLDTLSILIYGILRSGHSQLTKIASKQLPTTNHASRVKRMKRWVMHQAVDCQSYFIPFLSKILLALARQSHIHLAIDGSPVGSGCMCLMVSILWRKRALPLCWLVRRKRKGHFSATVHVELLTQLAALLPPHDNIVLVGDGEFDKIELMKFCQTQGWSFVFRTAKNTRIYPSDSLHPEPSCRMENLYPPLSERTYWMSEVYFTAKKYGLVHVFCHHDRRYKDPWYLVSNIDFPKQVIQLYQKRFGIETLFSDLKSRGFHIHKSQLRDPKRVEKLLIAVALAFIFTLLTGLKANSSKIKYLAKLLRQDQLNHFSCFQIGKLVWNACFDFPDYFSHIFNELLSPSFSVRF